MRKSDKRAKIPTLASTVILVREHNGGLQIYLLRRSTRSGFMPGNYVFPGGMLDSGDRDYDFWKTHLDMDLAAVSRRLGGELRIEDALAHGVAAIRETFEEAGVLLAHRSPQGKQDVARVCDRRVRSTLPKSWLREWVTAEDWSLAFSELSRWAHWITPKARSRQYDTRFFVALMPAGQECIPDCCETTEGVWASAESGLERNLLGELPLSPPTLVTLHELLQYPTLKALEKELEDRPWGETRHPLLIRSTRAAMIILPWDVMYDREKEIDCDAPQRKILAPGEPFSRLWYHEGLWIPVEN